MVTRRILPDVSCSRGAPMGRRSIWPDKGGSRTLMLEQLAVVDDCYDQGGAYWGAGTPVFWAYDDDDVNIFVRAKDREHAEQQIRESIPLAAFVYPVEVSASDTDDFLNGYVRAALFSSTDDNEKPLDDKCGFGDIAEGTLVSMREDCVKFLAEHGAEIVACGRGLDGGHTPGSPDDTVWNHAGRDFWYTRHGHGVGFWDGDWPKDLGKRLTAASKRFGEVCLYVGDDGKIHGHD